MNLSMRFLKVVRKAENPPNVCGDGWWGLRVTLVLSLAPDQAEECIILFHVMFLLHDLILIYHIISCLSIPILSDTCE